MIVFISKYFILIRYSPAQTIVASPHLSSASYLGGANLISTGAKVISNAGYAGTVYPATSGYVSGDGLLATGGHSIASTGGLVHSGAVVSSAYPNAGYVSPAGSYGGYYGAGSKLIAGNGLYAANGLYASSGAYANGLLGTAAGLRYAFASL